MTTPLVRSSSMPEHTLSASPAKSPSPSPPPHSRRATRVSFADLYQDSVDLERNDQSHGNVNGNERTTLLDHHHHDKPSDYDEEDEEVQLRCTLKGFFVALCVALVIAGIISGAILVRSTEHHGHVPAPKPFPTPPLPTGLPRNDAVLIKAANGAVASENKVCSDIGIDILKEGGSAVDAVIASNLCIGTVNMFSSGIGGGGFAIVRVPPVDKHSNSTVFTIDFRETAPALANATMYGRDSKLSKFGGLSVGVPGELRGLAEIHKRWGKLPWKRVVEPSAELARGWTVSAELDKKLHWLGQWILDDPDWRPSFAPRGELLNIGQQVSRPAYAQTLATIAAYGPEAFYKGPIAEAMVRKVRQTGGILSLKDLADYKPIIQPALEGSYRGRKVYTTHAPTSGAVVLHILNILETFDLVSEGRTPLNVHRVVEALKYGFAARTKVSDPAFVNSTHEMEEISTKKFAALVAKNITDDTTHTAAYYNPIYDVKEDHGTTHTSVVDKWGMAVALTSTVNLPFGSRVLDPETGIIMNDEMDDFSTPETPNAFGLWPSPYNYPAAGKRPLSSTAPTIIEHPNGDVLLAIGGSGGSRIFGAIVQVILGLDWGLDVSQAIEQPRVHDQLFPAVLQIESTFNKQETETLKALGHNITEFDINVGASEVQAVYVDGKGQYSAASDSRKHGVAAGY